MNCPINCPPRALRVPSCGQYRVLLEINTSPPWEHTHSSSVFPPLSNNLYIVYTFFHFFENLLEERLYARLFVLLDVSNVPAFREWLARNTRNFYREFTLCWIFGDSFWRFDSYCFGILYVWICIFLLPFFVFKLEIVFVWKSRVWEWKYEMKFTRL